MPASATIAKSPDWQEYFARTQALPNPERLKPFLDKLPKSATLLDFGCGTGRFAAAFHRDRPDLYIHVHDAQLDKANLLGPWAIRRTEPNFKSFHAHAEYDAIFAQASLFFELPENQQSLFTRLSEALKPGGLLAFTFLDGAQAIPLPGVYARTESELKTMLHTAKFTIESEHYRTDMVYGSEKLPIPTFIIHARKDL